MVVNKTRAFRLTGMRIRNPAGRLQGQDCSEIYAQEASEALTELFADAAKKYSSVRSFRLNLASSEIVFSKHMEQLGPDAAQRPVRCRLASTDGL